MKKVRSTCPQLVLVYPYVIAKFNPPVIEKSDVKNHQTVFNYQAALTKAKPTCPQLILNTSKMSYNNTIDTFSWLTSGFVNQRSKASRLHLSRFDKNSK